MKIFEQLTNGNIVSSIDKYKENNKLCGYELNTYTNGGVNMILFVDFRGTGRNPKGRQDFLALLKDRVESIDVEEEIEMHRQDQRYRDAFTLRESLEDFESYKTDLLEELSNLESI